jgi:hypothetical protein
MGDTVSYDEDVLAWAQQQASALRQLAGRRDLPNELDLVHVAEEIEDVGLSELRAVETQLENAMVHLVKLWAEPEALAASHREDEIFAWQSDLCRRVTNAMRRRMDLDALWSGAVRQAVKRLRRSPDAVRVRVAALAGSGCPWPLDDLTDAAFEPAIAVQRLPPGPA